MKTYGKTAEQKKVDASQLLHKFLDIQEVELTRLRSIAPKKVRDVKHLEDIKKDIANTQQRISESNC